MRAAIASVTGTVLGEALIGLCLRPAAAAPLDQVPLATVVLWFDVVLGRAAKLAECIASLHANHRDAVVTLRRERTYLEAIFIAPNKPDRLYRLTVQNPGGATVESSELTIDRVHRANIANALTQGSHRRLETRHVLVPDLLVDAVRRDSGSSAL